MLARVMGEHPDELRADLQEHYGLDIDGMGRDFSTLHAAALLAQMPEGSRTAMAYDPDAAWTSRMLLAASMANALNWLVWSRTEDGRRGRNMPRPIGPDSSGGGSRRIKGLAMAPDELMATIERIREEASRG